LISFEDFQRKTLEQQEEYKRQKEEEYKRQKEEEE